MSRLLLLVVVLFYLVSLITSTPLDDYVWKPDDNYKWEDLGEKGMFTGKFGTRGYTGYTLNMTSQRWLTDADFSASSQSGSIWWHYLVVIVPDDVEYSRNGTLYITGGSNDASAPPPTDSEDVIITAAFATGTKTITGCLFQIPNEHTTFSADPLQKSRTEDAVIAFTWDHFLNDPSQPEWLLRFPMVKASLRAMDTITDFAAKKFPDKNYQLDYYSVAGASKRGWTTWDVGAVDGGRVQAIIPIVLDAINFVDVMHHQYKSYNGWSFALKDYTEMDIMSRLDSDNMHLLQENVDPYFYKDRLTMPKLIVNACEDEFQMPDDVQYWWSGMPEPKHFMIVPNAEHSLITGILQVVPAVTAWVKYNLEKSIVPKMDWTIDETTGEITVTLNEHGIVHEANVWQAYSCGVNVDGSHRRDFRVAMLDSPCSCGVTYEGTCANLKSFWTKTPLNYTMEGIHRTYKGLVEPPTDGRWVAFMVEVTYSKLHLKSNDNRQLFQKPDIKDKIKDKIDEKVQDKKDEIHEKIEDKEQEVIDKWINVKAEVNGKILDNFPEFPHDLLGRLRFTSGVSILPNTFPFADCSGADCKGTLV